MNTTAQYEEDRAQDEGVRARQATRDANRTGQQVRNAEARLQALRQDVARQRQAVARLQRERGDAQTEALRAQVDALERDRAAAARNPSISNVQQIEQRAREIDAKLRQYGAI